MNVWNGIERVPPDAGPVVATIGNYDGVHRGHRAIIESVTSAARQRKATSLLITFDPHPLVTVAPSRRPRLLQTRRQKLETLEATGIDATLILRFDDGLARIEGEAFFRDFLLSRLSIEAVHVGANFKFGRGRAGDVDLLRRVGAAHRFAVVAVPPVVEGALVVSSSAIRTAIAAGEVEAAARMLGRPFSVAGTVVEGDGRGRELDHRTANLDLENETLPARGVYVTETRGLASRWPSVTNVGVRPTFGGEALRVETHLIDFDDALYGERLEVAFLARLRDERRFDSPADLADQIARDRAAAVAYHSSTGLPAR